MAQHDYNIANASFPSVRSDINDVLSAINTSNSGTSRPSGAVAGTIWLDTSGGATAHLLKFYDGGADITLATINTTANTVDFSDSAINIVTDTTPQLGGMLDVNGNAIGDGTLELLKFVETASAVNELTITNNSTGNNPILSATGGDTNIGLNLVSKGTGVLQGNGSALKIAGKETIWVPAVAMYPNSTSGCADLSQTELGNGPELKTLDFDKDSDEFAQFSVAFPKSWNEGTITFQAFFTANSTNTGNAVWKLQAVALADNGDLNTAFGTAVGVAKSHSGTANDLDVTTETGAVTIAGSPSTDEYVFFQIFRDANDGDDTLTADAKLLGIKLFYTTDASNDA